MNTDNTHNIIHHSLREEILLKIKEEKLTMRPKAYFTFMFVALVVIVVLVIAISLFLFSYMIFSIQASNNLFLLGFGTRGVLMFLLFFPWKIFFIDVLLILILELLLRKFRFGYKKPIVYMLLSLIVLLISSSILLEREIHFNRRIQNRVTENGLPIISGMYTDVRRPPVHQNGVCRCIVVEIDNNVLTVVDDDQDLGTTTELRIILPQNYATSSVHIGDRIFVAGEATNGTIQAYGLRKIGPISR